MISMQLCSSRNRRTHCILDQKQATCFDRRRASWYRLGTGPIK